MYDENREKINIYFKIFYGNRKKIVYIFFNKQPGC